MIPKKNRLKESDSIRAIRREGKSFSSEILVLMVLGSEVETTRVAFLASRSVGGAVQRNRCKRILRSRMTKLLGVIESNHDLLLIARKPLLSALANEIDKTLILLLEKARLICT